MRSPQVPQSFAQESGVSTAVADEANSRTSAQEQSLSLNTGQSREALVRQAAPRSSQTKSPGARVLAARERFLFRIKVEPC